MGIDVKNDGNAEQVPVRRQNSKGATTVGVSLTLPIALNDDLAGIAARDGKTKSLLVTELLQEALEAREGK